MKLPASRRTPVEVRPDVFLYIHRATEVTPTMLEREIVGCFQPLESPIGPTWWSARHGCFADVHQADLNGLTFGRGGPRRLAWNATTVVLERHHGVTLEELLAAAPVAVLHGDVRRYLVSRVCLPNRYGVCGWLFPTLREVIVGFDGRVAVIVRAAPAARYISHSESEYREEFAAERDAIDDAAKVGERAFREALDAGEEPWSEADAPLLAALVADLFPQRFSAYRYLVRVASTLPALPLPSDWDDCLLAREREVASYRLDAAYAELNKMVSGASDVFVGTRPPVEGSGDPHLEPATDAPAEVARFHLAREREVALWPLSEMVRWPAIRGERRRLVLGRRGLAPPDPTTYHAEAHIEGVLFDPLRRWPGDPFPKGALGAVHIPPEADPIIRRAASFAPGLATEGTFERAHPGEDRDATVAAAHTFFESHCLPALGVWLHGVIDGWSVERAREVWLQAWRGIDGELAPADLARLAAGPPRLPPSTPAQFARAAALIEEDDRKVQVKSKGRLPYASNGGHDNDGIAVELSDHIGVLERLVFSKSTVTVSTVAGCDIRLVHSEGAGRIRFAFSVFNGVLILSPRGLYSALTVDGRRCSANDRVPLSPTSVVAIARYRLRASLTAGAGNAPSPDSAA